MNKIIGFLIGKDCQVPNFDIFDKGLTHHVITHLGYKVILWGIGDIKSLIADDSISLAFPESSSLLDRNVIIKLKKHEIIVENDWLGSIPVFYNNKKHIVSTNLNLCQSENELDEVGIKGFLEFGYSVFERTIYRDTKFLRFYSTLTLQECEIKIQEKEDPVRSYSFTPVDPKNVITKISEYVNNVEDRIPNNLVIPTSGGYDSRLLNCLVRNKEKVRSYTYGISSEQGDSQEVVYASKIAEILGTEWKHIELSKYFNYIDDWFKIFGPSVHLHGMYHIDFYNSISKETNTGDVLLSGIFGDVWAGSVSKSIKNKIIDFDELGYKHGLCVSEKNINNICNKNVKKQFLTNNDYVLGDERLFPLLVIRTKLILISYLMQLPEYFGLVTSTPFLNFDIAMSMLGIDKKDREDRLWQKTFFSETNMDLESLGIRCDHSNSLDFNASLNHNFSAIDESALTAFVKGDYIASINKNLNGDKTKAKLVNRLLITPKVGFICRKLGLKNSYLNSLNGYLVLKSLEMGIKNVR